MTRIEEKQLLQNYIEVLERDLRVLIRDEGKYSRTVKEFASQYRGRYITYLDHFVDYVYGLILSDIEKFKEETERANYTWMVDSNFKDCVELIAYHVHHLLTVQERKEEAVNFLNTLRRKLQIN